MKLYIRSSYNGLIQTFKIFSRNRSQTKSKSLTKNSFNSKSTRWNFNTIVVNYYICGFNIVKEGKEDVATPKLTKF